MLSKKNINDGGVVMDEWIENPYIHMIFKLMFAREKQTKEQLMKLEEELCTQNRFFPQNQIINTIDKLIDAPHKILDERTVIYRARKIDKYEEDVFFEAFFGEIYSMIKEAIPDFDESASYYEMVGLSYLYYKDKMKPVLSDEHIQKLYDKYGEKGWWGFSEIESDAPPRGKASAGRINPNGISYLYASDNEQTAALEVRPTVSQFVSIAEIEIKSKVRLFDFTSNYEFEEAKRHFDQSIDMTVLGEYFSQPNYSGESTYLATQYISEYIKHLKDERGENIFDGLCFRSSLDGRGINYVLFNVSDDRKYLVKNSSVYQVMDLMGNLQRQLPLPKDI